MESTINLFISALFSLVKIGNCIPWGIFCIRSVCINYLLPSNKTIVTYKTSKIKLKRRRRRIFSSGLGVALFSSMAYIDICLKAQPVTRLSC